MPNYNSQSYNLSIRPGDPSVFLFGIPTNVAITSAVRVNNSVTFTFAANHNTVAGMPLFVIGMGTPNKTGFNGNYVVTSITSATVLVAQPIDKGYNTPQPNDAGGTGGIGTVIAAEQPAAPPQQSISVAIADSDIGANKNASIEIFFTGAPGAFEVDMMEADTDTANAYQIGSGGQAKVTVVTANNTARIDMTNLLSKFVAANLASRTNAVGVIIKLSR